MSLEFFVADDLAQAIVAPSFHDLIVLAAIVGIRTFLTTASSASCAPSARMRRARNVTKARGAAPRLLGADQAHWGQLLAADQTISLTRRWAGLPGRLTVAP